MSHITENVFKSLLIRQLHKNPLIDRSLLTVIYSFNNFGGNINFGLSRACKFNSPSLTQILIEKGACDFDWALQGAGEGGNIDMIWFLIKLNLKHIQALSLSTLSSLDVDDRRIKWEYGLFGACAGGHKDIAQLIINIGCNQFNFGMSGACRGGHNDFALWMIQKGANSWDNGLREACCGGYKNTAELMILMGANNWDVGLCEACKGGHKDLAELMIKNGANDWDKALNGACDHKKKDLSILMFNYGIKNNSLAVSTINKFKYFGY